MTIAPAADGKVEISVDHSVPATDCARRSDPSTVLIDGPAFDCLSTMDHQLAHQLAVLAQNRDRMSISQKSARVRSKTYVARTIDLMM